MLCDNCKEEMIKLMKEIRYEMEKDYISWEERLVSAEVAWKELLEKKDYEYSLLKNNRSSCHS